MVNLRVSVFSCVMIVILCFSNVAYSKSYCSCANYILNSPSLIDAEFKLLSDINFSDKSELLDYGRDLNDIDDRVGDCKNIIPGAMKVNDKYVFPAFNISSISRQVGYLNMYLIRIRVASTEGEYDLLVNKMREQYSEVLSGRLSELKQELENELDLSDCEVI